jgi:hypothetical protein
MAKIGLIQVDGKIPNLALMKLAKHYESLGHEIFFIDLSTIKADFWFGSKIFMGGSGYDIKATLPKEVEEITPDYEKFGLDYSIGFTSRGCIRNCDFCIVREKEGLFHNVDMSWIKQKKVLLLDNNFLASPEWKEKLQYFIDKKIKVCFNQGLDVRLITEEKAEMLSKVDYRDDQFKTKRIYFAWDNIKDEEAIVRGIGLLTSAGIKPQNIMVYVLVGFNSTFEQDMYRTKKLIDLKVKPFIMQYNRNSTKKRDPKLIDLARWINKRYYNFVKFEDYKGRGSKLNTKELAIPPKPKDLGILPTIT